MYYTKPACLGDEDLPDPRHYHAPRDYKLPPRKLKNFCMVPQNPSQFRPHICLVPSCSVLVGSYGNHVYRVLYSKLSSWLPSLPLLLLLQGVGNIKYTNRKIPALSDAAAADFDEVKEVHI